MRSIESAIWVAAVYGISLVAFLLATGGER